MSTSHPTSHPDNTPKGLAGEHVHLDEDWQVDYWKTHLGVSRSELIDAVRAVGDDLERVKQHLAQRHTPPSGPQSG